jgi:hypothetical protein
MRAQSSYFCGSAAYFPSASVPRHPGVILWLSQELSGDRGRHEDAFFDPLGVEGR